MTPTRTESFVPLTSHAPRPAGDRLAFRATVLTESSAPQTVQQFAPAVIPSAAPASAPTPVPAPQPQTVCEPKVSVQRDGNRVTGIQILCSCGQVIDLACVYDAIAPQSVAAGV
jgi:hypothetical protein